MVTIKIINFILKHILLQKKIIQFISEIISIQLVVFLNIFTKIMKENRRKMIKYSSNQLPGLG